MLWAYLKFMACLVSWKQPTPYQVSHRNITDWIAYCQASTTAGSRNLILFSESATQTAKLDISVICSFLACNENFLRKHNPRKFKRNHAIMSKVFCWCITWGLLWTIKISRRSVFKAIIKYHCKTTPAKRAVKHTFLSSSWLISFTCSMWGNKSAKSSCINKSSEI